MRRWALALDGLLTYGLVILGGLLLLYGAWGILGLHATAFLAGAAILAFGLWGAR